MSGTSMIRKAWSRPMPLGPASPVGVPRPLVCAPNWVET